MIYIIENEDFVTLLRHFQMPPRCEMLAIIELPRLRVHVYGRLHGQAVRRGRRRVRDDVAVQKRCHLPEHQRLLPVRVREGLRGPRLHHQYR